jgi:hypothetical protein
MIELDLMQYKDLLRVKKEKSKTFLFDPLRKKWLVLQPEELVRQLIILYLIRERGYNSNRIKVEKGLKVNDLYKRCDVLIYNLAVEPLMLVECKAPQVKVNQETFRQIAHYNLPLRVPYLLVTNGIRTYCCRMDYETEDFEYLEEVPVYEKA